MAKTHYLAASLYRLGAGIVSGALLWLQLSEFGLDAWRVFETWLLAAAVLYFLIAAVVAFWQGRHAAESLNFCPMLQGALITLGIGVVVLWLTFEKQALVWPGAAGGFAWLRLGLVPALAALDWVLFTKKGSWQLCYPWYWAALVLIFACAILLTAGLLRQETWQYPYFFLNYPANSIEYMFWWMLVIVAVILVIGYAIVTLDELASGKIGEHIVMPRIKTIIIEEELPAEPVQSEIPSAKPAAKPIVQPKPQPKPTQPQGGNKASAKTQPTKPQTPKPQAAKPQTKPARKSPSLNDVVKPVEVEGLKDRKSAQKLHRNNRSKSEIIADMRLQVSGAKKNHSSSKPATKKA